MSEQDPGIELHEIENAHKEGHEGEHVEHEDPVSPGTKWFPEFEHGLNDQSKKIVAITGTTSGTGMIATMTALRKGATIYCLNRNCEKAENSLAPFFENHPATKERCFSSNAIYKTFQVLKQQRMKLQQL